MGTVGEMSVFVGVELDELEEAAEGDVGSIALHKMKSGQQKLKYDPERLQNDKKMGLIYPLGSLAKFFPKLYSSSY